MTIEDLKKDIKWWETKRWIYNLCVGVFGAYGIYIGLSQSDYYWATADTFGIIWWGLGANVFYSLGILFEIFDWYYLKSRIGIRDFRLFLFLLGTIFSCLWTFWCTWIYFIGYIF